MANDLVNKTEKDFESIKHVDENGVEFWYARELMIMLEYSKWGNFVKVIDKAKESCKNSNINTLNHFADVGKMIVVAKLAGVKNYGKFNNYGYRGLYKEHYQQGQLLGCAPLL